MEMDFNKGAPGTKGTDYAFAKELFERLRWSDAQDAVFSVTKSLIVPVLQSLRTGEALDSIERALDPATDNIDTECRFTRPDRTKPWRLRDAVFPKPKHYEETGSEGNRQLAKILNELTNLVEKNPIDALKQAATGEGVMHLPENPEKMRVKGRLEEGAAFKERVRTVFEREFVRLLFTDSVGIGSELNYALHQMPGILKDGDAVAKTMTDVINDAGAIGKIMAYHSRHNPDFTLEEAVRIRSTPSVARQVVPAHDKV